MNKEAEAYKTAYARERAARLEAEQLLDDKSRELFLKNQQLEASNTRLKEQHNALVRNESWQPWAHCPPVLPMRSIIR
ncbi:hypothetical protein [Aliamphritea spongicola]|nr:hypothetical protein [Aliamphritea spongicola]